MFDINNIQTVIESLEQERGLPREVIIEAVEHAFAAAYKREYGKQGQDIRSKINYETKDLEYFQRKTVIDFEKELQENPESKINEDKYIDIKNASFLKNNVEEGDEILFPLEGMKTFGRIAVQAAKQALIYYFRDAERKAVVEQFLGMEGSLVSGVVRRIERGNIFIDLKKTIAVMPFFEQVRKESFRPGDQVLSVIVSIDKDSNRGSFITVSRASVEFVKKLFEQESPELANGGIEIKRIARNPGFRTKMVVASVEDWVDPVGAVVGQRGLRVMMVRNELQGEQIDIVEWKEDFDEFAQAIFSPVAPERVSFEGDKVVAQVADKDVPLVLGYRGQNLKLTGEVLQKNIDIVSEKHGLVAAYVDGEVTVHQILDLDREEEDASEETVAEETSDESVSENEKENKE